MKRLIVPPLGGRVAAFEQDHMFRAGLWWPVLKLQELDLEGVLLIFVLVAVHPTFHGGPRHHPDCSQHGLSCRRCVPSFCWARVGPGCCSER